MKMASEKAPAPRRDREGQEERDQTAPPAAAAAGRSASHQGRSSERVLSVATPALVGRVGDCSRSRGSDRLGPGTRSVQSAGARSELHLLLAGSGDTGTNEPAAGVPWFRDRGAIRSARPRLAARDERHVPLRRVGHAWSRWTSPDARPARAPGARARIRASTSSSRARPSSSAPAAASRGDWGDPIRRAAIEARLHGGSLPVEASAAQGWSVVEQVLVHEQLGQSTGGLWSYIPGAYNVLIHADAEQRRRYLDPSLRGERSGSYAITEDGAGSDARTLRRDGRPRRGDRRLRPQRREVVRDRAPTTPTS